MTNGYPTLFDEGLPDLGPEPVTDAPVCPLCLRPAMWRPIAARWSRYCGPSQCVSPYRICRMCGERFDPAAGRTKYCSLACMQTANGQVRAKSAQPCVACGNMTRPTTVAAALPFCGGCATEWRGVMNTMRAHHVDPERVRRLFQDRHGCEICGVDMLTPQYITSVGRMRRLIVVDHDHDCCPSGLSCGKCVRGLICTYCNHVLTRRVSPEILRRMADYLDGQPG